MMIEKADLTICIVDCFQSYTELLSWRNLVAAHASTPMLPIGLSQCCVIMVSLCIAIAKQYRVYSNLQWEGAFSLDGIISTNTSLHTLSYF
jgi:hypothetical protein